MRILKKSFLVTYGTVELNTEDSLDKLKEHANNSNEECKEFYNSH